MDYKATLNLPKTDFPMKASLTRMEPEMLRRWEEMDIYGRLRQVSAGRPLWILHDGPPYANAPIHMGQALNKILKDIIVKSRSMLGTNTVYVPGWDCHGLPIEHQVDKELGLDKPPAMFAWPWTRWRSGGGVAHTPSVSWTSSARSSSAWVCSATGTTRT